MACADSDAAVPAVDMGQTPATAWRSSAGQPPATPSPAVDLRSAIDGGELDLGFQGIADLGSGRVLAAQAVIAWRHPKLGLLDGCEVAALAGRAGLGRRLGAWLLAKAIGQAAAWAEDPVMQLLQICVDLTVHQLLDDDMVAGLAEALQLAAAPAGALCVHVDEPALLMAEEIVPGRLQALRDLGVQVAVAGFGTGSMSMAQLRSAAVDVVRLDPSLVTDLPGDVAQDAIVATIQQVVDALRLTSVAVGVDRPEQREALERLGVHMGQGATVHQPSTPAALAAQVAAAELPRS